MLKLRSPATLAIALGLVGVVGGVTVFLTAARISEADRDAIVAWEREVTDLVGEARALTLGLSVLADPASGATCCTRDDSLPVRVALDRARRELPGVRTPPILVNPTQSMTKWVWEATFALTIVEGAAAEERALDGPERERLREQLATADAFYLGARDALIRLRCRARLPSCLTSSLPD